MRPSRSETALRKELCQEPSADSGLNPTKSEVIQFTATRGRDRVDDVAAIRVSNVAIPPVSTVRSLGVTLDQKLSFDQHVTNVCRSCHFHIRALLHVRESLPDEVVKTVACSLVGSRLDYCNGLFAGMTQSNFTRLQRVQNTLTRVVLRRGKFQHIAPALKELHWLPVEHRVTYKLAFLAFTIKNSGQPAYLRELLPVRTLRSSSKHLICKDRTETVLASRGFRHSAAAAWNNLPNPIRCTTNLDSFNPLVPCVPKNGTAIYLHFVNSKDHYFVNISLFVGWQHTHLCFAMQHFGLCGG